jgi:hypothetical protein
MEKHLGPYIAPQLLLQILSSVTPLEVEELYLTKPKKRPGVVELQGHTSTLRLESSNYSYQVARTTARDIAYRNIWYVDYKDYQPVSGGSTPRFPMTIRTFFLEPTSRFDLRLRDVEVNGDIAEDNFILKFSDEALPVLE